MIRFALSPRKAVLALLLFNAASSLLGNTDLSQRGWDDIPEEELAVMQAKVDSDADAEFLYRSIWVNDEGVDTTFRYHNRAKIYTEAGVEKWDKVDLSYNTGWSIRKIRARIIYPDRTVAYLDAKDVFDRQIYKDDEFEGNSKSFSFPNLKPGCIIEYKWEASRRYWTPNFDFPIRAEWPTWEFDITVNPNSSMASRIVPYNCQLPIEKKHGKYVFKITDQPAISTKSHLPPRKNFEPFIYMEYARELKQLTKEKYWNYRGGEVVSINKSYVRAKQKEVKKLAAELFEGLTHGEDKLKVAYEYCTSELTNISSYTNKYTEEELENLKENDNPNMTIQNGYGTRYDINSVFASLASAAGFYARLAQVENRQHFAYRASALGSFNLSDWIVAIRYGETWRYFDPGSSFLPIETLNPENTDADVITTDKDYFYIKKTEAVAADYSSAERKADVTIDEYGDLKGTVSILYTGYESLWRKRLLVAMTHEEREDYIEETQWVSRLPRATIDDLKFEYADLRNNKLKVTYSVEVPGYADVLEDRVVLVPSLFEVGKPRVFPEETRTEWVSFNYKTQADDIVNFKIPDGYRLEKTLEKRNVLETKLLDIDSWLVFDADENVLTCHRNYTMKILQIPARAYSIVKKIFDYLSIVDSNPIALVAEVSEGGDAQ